jgi:hypothetical protein
VPLTVTSCEDFNVRQLTLLVLFGLLGIGVHAQWLNYPTPGIPRTKDGKPNLTAPAPRTADGRPDLSGVCNAADAAGEMKRLFGDDAELLPCRDGAGHHLEIRDQHLRRLQPRTSIRPEAAAILQRRLTSTTEFFSPTHCLPAGIPLATLVTELTKIVQTPGLTLIWLELDSAMRQIYTDGRPHPVNRNPSWLGYSIGKWDKDTLVVDTVGFNDKTWLDAFGHPHSEAMRVVERYRRRDFGHMDVEITIDDPQMYTKPFTIKVTHELQADTDILEYFCNENEKDRGHMGK